jgi:hypothetical protein
MLDPGFGYSPMLTVGGLSPAQQRPARERYRLLWDITIDGRLSAAGYAPLAERDQYIRAFSRAYSFWPTDQQSRAFESLWSKEAPNHAKLLSLACDPRALRDTQRPAAGAPCPLCGFPTFDWAETARVWPAITRRIALDYPAWSPEQGACSRCLEIYEAVDHLSTR